MALYLKTHKSICEIEAREMSARRTVAVSTCFHLNVCLHDKGEVHLEPLLLLLLNHFQLAINALSAKKVSLR